MQTIMELVQKHKLTDGESLIQGDDATDADMNSLCGFGHSRFYNNISLRQMVIERAGFRLFVKPEFALNFKYAASLYTLACRVGDVYGTEGLVYDGVERKDKRYAFEDGGGRVYYRGVLPLFVLNRVRLAVGLGIRHITIHSNEKSLVNNIVKGDPVIVGWQGFMHLFDYLICNNKANCKPRWYRTAPSCIHSDEERNPFGFIIAIFGDGDVI